MRAACCVNAAPVSGIAYCKGSAGGPVGKHELELAEHQVPVLTPGLPVLYDPLRRETSLVKLGLFLVICRNWRFRPSMILVVYMIFRISAGYS